MTQTDILTALSSTYSAEFQRIRRQFEESRDSGAALRERSYLVDRVVGALYEHLISAEPGGPAGLCLIAVGGYGRRELHPYSDIDLAFVCADAGAESAHRDATAAVLRSVWDLGLRSSGGLRTLSECRTVLGNNPEFAIALLDARYLGGDPELFTALHDRTLPEVIARERHALVANIEELTGQRHKKHGDTIFHLEPNIKDAPGGLRDYHVARWLTEIAALDERGGWAVPEDLWPQAFSSGARAAFDFLTASRCFIHYRRERDDNHITYGLQDEAAQERIGVSAADELSPAEWMRSYFRHARLVDALARRLLDETTRSRRSLMTVYEDWRSRLSNTDFSVIGGRIFLRQPEAAAQDARLTLRLFEMVARHGLRLSSEAERVVTEAVPRLEPNLRDLAEVGLSLQEILLMPHGAQSLRVMHQVGLLVAIIPEFKGIDALVTRDSYHRYTVDEHTFVAIQTLHDLETAKRRPAGSEAHEQGLSPAESRFAALLGEIERPELVFLALLLHDLGKSSNAGDHVQTGLKIAEGVLARLGTSPEEDRSILFLIAHHLDMSSTLLRRDILDPATIREFGRKVGSVERLKMLTLLTFADVKSVNPEALTPWKADALWQLYVSTANDLARSLDDERLTAADDAALDIGGELPAKQSFGPPSDLHGFLAGFPQRYLAVHAPGEIIEHLDMAKSLDVAGVVVRTERQPSYWALTVITRDRPLLFATITGVLASWGMNIVKAEAFSNAQSIVLDTFAFHDLHRTLDLNASEVIRLEQNLTDALAGKASLAAIREEVASRSTSPRPRRNPVPAQVRFDDTSSAHSSLLELVTADRPGLLFDVSFTLAELGCSIDVALIDTEGQRAIDVFYLTAGGAKLSPEREAQIRTALLQLLSEPRPKPVSAVPVTAPRAMADEGREA
jgi:[protein-PII] uridylyltransferase